MKKLILSFALAAFAVSASNAQSIVNNPDNKAFWGVRVGLDVSCPTKATFKEGSLKESESLFKSGVGVSVGAIYHLPIVANFYFEPGASLFYNTWSNNLDDLDKDEKELINHNSYRQTGIRVPLNLGYHFDFTDKFKVSVFTGPQLQVGFSCDQYIGAKDEGVEYHEAPSMYSGDEGFNRFNASWNVGIGFTYSKFYLGITGSLEMTNMMRYKKDKDDDWSYTSHMNTLGIALGYNF